MENTIVGVYDNFQSAQSALNDLIKSGFAIERVKLSPEDDTLAARQSALLRESGTEERSKGVFGMFRNLFSTPDETRHPDMYSEAVRRGSFLLAVHTENDDQDEQVSDIMNRYDPVDIEERANYWKAEGWSKFEHGTAPYGEAEIAKERTRYAATSKTGTKVTEQRAIPVVQEELQVGKRVVQRGGVRVFRHVTETPVHETVHLREEHVSVERRPVNQPADAADLASLKDESFEVRESAEEAVVAKSARVVEEVVVGKEVTERDQVINETVRRTDVEVEQLAGGMDDSAFRSHWSSKYGAAGGKYEDYALAYQYGASLAADERYRNYRFSDVEPDIERDWTSQHAGQPWSRVKDAVRYGWERIPG